MIRERIAIDNALLLVWEITESIEELVQKFEQFELIATDFEKISSEKRKKEFLGVRLAMKYLLEKEVLICYEPEGKPYLFDNSFQISVSHSGKWIAVMAHPTRTVGIDIECPSDKIQKLYTRFLSKTEQDELYNEQDNRKLQLAWSAKEVLYKIIGNQAVDFAKQLRILPFEIKEKGKITGQHIPTETLYKLAYTQNEAYTLAYCIA